MEGPTDARRNEEDLTGNYLFILETSNKDLSALTAHSSLSSEVGKPGYPGGLITSLKQGETRRAGSFGLARKSVVQHGT